MEMGDRISNLPGPLMEKIMFGLPSKDSIRMSFSSKQWQILWNSKWNSIPVSSMEFNNCSFGGKRMLSRKNFAALVDDSLRKNLPAGHEDQKKIVEFRLAVETLSSKEMNDYDVIDRWIKIVTRNYVKVLTLEIDFAPKIRYQFPPAAFDVGVLVELELMHCTLEKTLFIQEHTVFIRLKQLSFRHVDFNEVAVGELLSRCPLLENLKFPYLESLLYFEDGKPMDIEAVSCTNLKQCFQMRKRRRRRLGVASLRRSLKAKRRPPGISRSIRFHYVQHILDLCLVLNCKAAIFLLRIR